jgi:hypothetical protein
MYIRVDVLGETLRRWQIASECILYISFVCTEINDLDFFYHLLMRSE